MTQSEDLKKEIELWIEKQITGVNPIYTTGAVGCIIVNTARHFANWQKEQLMKNCLYDTEVMLHTKQNNTEYLTLANDKLPHISVSCGLKVGDKVKVLIVKEDEQ